MSVSFHLISFLSSFLRLFKAASKCCSAVLIKYLPISNLEIHLIFDLWKTNSGRAPPKGHNTLLEASYRHLLESPLHYLLEKVEAG
jgi:hypothetical protein